MNTRQPLDLRKLRHAIALAELGTFTRASQELHLTQSALTRSIQKLESDLGIAIFERLPGGVRPTTSGKALLARAQSLLLQANGLQHDADLLRGGKVGTLTFGLGPMLAPWLVPVLSALATDAPRLDVRIEIEPIHRLQEMLRAEEVEFFVADISLLAKDASVVQERIGSMQVCYFVRSGHPLAAYKISTTKEEVQQYPLLFAGLPGLRETSGDVADWIGLISCENVGMLKDVAQHSDAILLATPMAMMEELKAGRFVAIGMHNLPQWTSDVRVVALADRSRSPLAQRVITELARQAQATDFFIPPQPAIAT